MSDVFISYARSTAKQAQAAAEALKALGYSVWLDDELLAHHAYTHAIEEQLTAAKAALVIWSAEAVKSEWVLSEANRAREDHKLVQLTVDGSRLQMPFHQHAMRRPRTVGRAIRRRRAGSRSLASIAELIGATTVAAAPLPPAARTAIRSPPSSSCPSPTSPAIRSRTTSQTAWWWRSSRRSPAFARSSSSPRAPVYRSRARELALRKPARQLGVRYVSKAVCARSARPRAGSPCPVDRRGGWRCRSGPHRFEDTLEDVFALQDKGALAVAGRIEPTVQQADTRRAVRARPHRKYGKLRALSIARLRSFSALRSAGQRPRCARPGEPRHGVGPWLWPGPRPAPHIAAHRLWSVVGGSRGRHPSGQRADPTRASGGGRRRRRAR